MAEHLRYWLELSYFVSGIVIALAVVYGLKQIGILKRDIRLRNERAAKEKAIEYGSRYLREYVDLDARFFDACLNDEPNLYSGPVGDFTAGSLPPDGPASDRLLKRYGQSAWLPAMNELEVIAAAFVSGVADESAGFKIIGRSFCATVASHYDLIAFSRGRARTAQNYWHNIVHLYKIWSPRLTESELREARGRLDQRIARVSSQTSRIRPIGTE